MKNKNEYLMLDTNMILTNSSWSLKKLAEWCKNQNESVGSENFVIEKKRIYVKKDYAISDANICKYPVKDKDIS